MTTKKKTALAETQTRPIQEVDSPGPDKELAQLPDDGQQKPTPLTQSVNTAQDKESGAEPKKPLVLHAKDFNESVYPTATEEYDEGEFEGSDVVIVANKEETFAYFAKISDREKASAYQVGVNQRYDFQYAISKAEKLLS